jgi:hypothetical protein
MQEDLHVTEAQTGAEISPKLLHSRGNIYSTSPTTVRQFSGNNYQLLATATGQNNPTIDLMWGYTPLGWRRDFLLVMSFFQTCDIRIADLPVSVLGVSELAKLWNGQDISARRHGCVAATAQVGTCEGWFVGKPLDHRRPERDHADPARRGGRRAGGKPRAGIRADRPDSGEGDQHHAGRGRLRQEHHVGERARL